MVTQVNIGSGFWLAPDPAASFQPLQAALHAAFGFQMILTQETINGHLYYSGAGRTPAEQAVINPGQTASDHVLGRAIDIFNQREFRDHNEPEFLRILGDHGWHNVDISGQPFPREPWHFAKHGLTTAATDSSPLDNSIPRRKNKMTTLYNVGGTPTVALAGDSPGTPANWLETSAASLITSWQDAHGALNVVDAKTYAAWKAAYLTPLAISGTTAGPSIDLTHVADDLDAIEAAVKAIKIPTKATVELS